VHTVNVELRESKIGNENGKKKFDNQWFNISSKGYVEDVLYIVLDWLMVHCVSVSYITFGAIS